MNSIEINKEKLVSWRRHLHMNPELSGEEKETSAYLAQQLRLMGLKVIEGVAGYGLVAELEGDLSKKCVALRADMDALPVTEQNDCAYKSCRQGAMHACGHDAHMAIVLGVAAALVQNPPGGTVKFIFQPSEEKPPGGAKSLIEAGVLLNPDVDEIFGLHVSALYPTGTVVLRNGVMMAIADDFELTLNGKAGHAATPHLAGDTISAAAQVIQSLQSTLSRRVDPLEPVVLSIGTIHGGTAQNVIADKVVITGTVRTLNEQARKKVIAIMNETLDSISSMWGITHNLEYIYGYPAVNNNSQLLEKVRRISQEISEVSSIIDMEKPIMAGEDFSYYGMKVPAVFFLLGCGSNTKNYPWHHGNFDIEEDALLIGSKILAKCAYEVASQDKELHR